MIGAARPRAPLVLLTLGAAALAGILLVPLAAAWRIAPDLGHGWGAPLLIAYLLWERWSEHPAARAQPAVPAGFWIGIAGISLMALPLRLLLEPFPLWPMLVWAYTGLLAAAALAFAYRVAGGPGVRWLGGPLIILAGALSWPSGLDRAVILPLRETMAAAAAEIANLLGHPALAEGTSVRLGTDWVGVDEACGGIRSLQAAVMAALFLGEWLRFSWGRRIGIVLTGVAAAVLGNFARILFLALRATAGSQAALAAHDAAGWLALTLTLGLTGLAAWLWARNRTQAVRVRGRTESSAPLSLGAAAGLVVFALCLGVEEAGVRLWYDHGENAAARQPHWTARLPQDAWNFQREPLSRESQEMLRPDLYAAASWEGPQNRIYSAYYIEWHEGQIARFVPFLHNPTVCLPSSGCELERPLGDITVRWEGGEIPFHSYLFRQSGHDLAVAFAVWDTSRNQPMTTDPEGWKGWFQGRWEEVREARRNQPAQMLSLAIAGIDGQSELATTLQSLIARP